LSFRTDQRECEKSPSGKLLIREISRRSDNNRNFLRYDRSIAGEISRHPDSHRDFPRYDREELVLFNHHKVYCHFEPTKGSVRNLLRTHQFLRRFLVVPIAIGTFLEMTGSVAEEGFLPVVRQISLTFKMTKGSTGETLSPQSCPFVISNPCGCASVMAVRNLLIKMFVISNRPKGV
jgi:hypothetical protein